MLLGAVTPVPDPARVHLKVHAVLAFGRRSVGESPVVVAAVNLPGPPRHRLHAAASLEMITYLDGDNLTRLLFAEGSLVWLPAAADHIHGVSALMALAVALVPRFLLLSHVEAILSWQVALTPDVAIRCANGWLDAISSLTEAVPIGETPVSQAGNNATSATGALTGDFLCRLLAAISPPYGFAPLDAVASTADLPTVDQLQDPVV